MTSESFRFPGLPAPPSAPDLPPPSASDVPPPPVSLTAPAPSSPRQTSSAKLGTTCAPIPPAEPWWHDDASSDVCRGGRTMGDDGEPTWPIYMRLELLRRLRDIRGAADRPDAVQQRLSTGVVRRILRNFLVRGGRTVDSARVAPIERLVHADFTHERPVAVEMCIDELADPRVIYARAPVETRLLALSRFVSRRVASDDHDADLVAVARALQTSGVCCADTVVSTDGRSQFPSEIMILVLQMCDLGAVKSLHRVSQVWRAQTRNPRAWSALVMMPADRFAIFSDLFPRVLPKLAALTVHSKEALPVGCEYRVSANYRVTRRLDFRTSFHRLARLQVRFVREPRRDRLVFAAGHFPALVELELSAARDDPTCRVSLRQLFRLPSLRVLRLIELAPAPAAPGRRDGRKIGRFGDGRVAADHNRLRSSPHLLDGSDANADGSEVVVRVPRRIERLQLEWQACSSRSTEPIGVEICDGTRLVELEVARHVVGLGLYFAAAANAKPPTRLDTLTVGPRRLAHMLVANRKQWTAFCGTVERLVLDARTSRFVAEVEDEEESDDEDADPYVERATEFEWTREPPLLGCVATHWGASLRSLTLRTTILYDHPTHALTQLASLSALVQLHLHRYDPLPQADRERPSFVELLDLGAERESKASTRVWPRLAVFDVDYGLDQERAHVGTRDFLTVARVPALDAVWLPPACSLWRARQVLGGQGGGGDGSGTVRSLAQQRMWRENRVRHAWLESLLLRDCVVRIGPPPGAPASPTIEWWRDTLDDAKYATLMSPRPRYVAELTRAEAIGADLDYGDVVTKSPPTTHHTSRAVD